MTVKIGDCYYRNVAIIEDYQTRNITVRLRFNGGETKEIPVTENDEIIFAMKDNCVIKP